MAYLVASCRLFTSIFLKIFFRCVMTVWVLMFLCWAISLVVCPDAMAMRISLSVCVSCCCGFS